MKKRLIPCIFLKNGMIVRSEKFRTHQIIGNPVSQVKRFSDWSVDEIIYIDISKSDKHDSRRDDHKIQSPDNKLELLNFISKHVFVPLAFGGGIRTIDDIQRVLQMGADKVVLNSGVMFDSCLLKKAAHIVGSQALVVCVDYKDNYVYFQHGTKKSGHTVSEWCAFLEENGVGEILLHDISRDGLSSGYDLDTVKAITKQVRVPVIALGGAGDYYDFVECFEESDPSAVAAGNIFHFKEHSYYHAKRALDQAGVNIRREPEDCN